MPTGVVDFYNEEKGFGFILPDDESTPVFIHFQAIVSDGFKTLAAGQRVSYSLIQGRKGPIANEIMVI